MRINRTLPIVATLILGLGQVTESSQTYFYSGPINGWMQVALTPGGVGNGGFTATFGTLTETLYYDPVAGTLEEVGSVTVSPSSGSFSIDSANSLPPESGSATLTVGNDGIIPFDIIFAGLGSPSVNNANILVPVSGSGSYNGQSLAGSWNLDVQLLLTSYAVSPTSLTISEFQAPNAFPGGIGAGGAQFVIPGTDLATGVNDGTYYYQWGQDSIVAMATPEPNSLTLLILGLSVLAFSRLRLRSLVRASGVPAGACVQLRRGRTKIPARLLAYQNRDSIAGQTRLPRF